MEFIELRPGESVEGQEIKAFRTDKKADKYIYLIAGTHGDEVEGVYVLSKLFDWLKEEDTKIQYALVVIPVLNVDGYRAGTRVNSHMIDLNRNLPSKQWSADYKEDKYNPGKKPLSEPENIFLDKIFEKFPPKLIISFHSWKPVINFDGEIEHIANFLAKHNNYPIDKHLHNHPTPGSLGQYAPQKYLAPVLTLECPTIEEGASLQEIWQENEPGLLSLMVSNLMNEKA
ncbi:MAG: DUF2817 domain-containing protein [Halobacteriovoraceae bacterium]|nr:DUF2817 domain-containing protein [Halobacteriovoraceae bacterium]